MTNLRDVVGPFKSFAESEAAQKKHRKFIASHDAKERELRKSALGNTDGKKKEVAKKMGSPTRTSPVGLSPRAKMHQGSYKTNADALRAGAERIKALKKK